MLARPERRRLEVMTCSEVMLALKFFSQKPEDSPTYHKGLTWLLRLAIKKAGEELVTLDARKARFIATGRGGPGLLNLAAELEALHATRDRCDALLAELEGAA